MVKRGVFAYFLIFLTIFLLYIIITLDKLIFPQVLIRGEQILKGDVSDTIRNIIIHQCSDLKNSDDYIFINKKEDGSISSIQSNGIKLNAVAFNIAKLTQEEFNKIKSKGISVPFGYVLKSSLFSHMGPMINVKLDDISYIETNYRSEFIKSGINQTVYKVYITYDSNIRIILSNGYKDVNIKTEMPIFETVIVGDTPEGFIDLNLENSGIKLKEGE